MVLETDSGEGALVILEQRPSLNALITDTRLDARRPDGTWQRQRARRLRSCPSFMYPPTQPTRHAKSPVAPFSLSPFSSPSCFPRPS